MNSKQRRQLDRKTKYKVTITQREGESWLDYDDRSEDAVKWCRKKAKGAYVIQNGFHSATFKFQKESDAVHFGLMWI
jgi:hypothetical protein